MIKNNRGTINAWAMYDWANSVYSLVISTAILPAYYNAFAVSASGGDLISFFGMEIINTVLYSYALSFSFLFVALLVPFLSGIADYTGRKLLFMKLFVYLGSLACISLYFFEGSNVEWGIMGATVASVGYSGSLVFYDAFLPEIASSDQFDRVSAKGYSLGYIGSVILLLFNIFSIEAFEMFGFENAKQAMKFSFLLVGIWWFGFSMIPFTKLPQQLKRVTDSGYFTKGYRELYKVYQQIKHYADMKIFLAAFFFYNTGVQTVILLASTFAAKVLGMEMGDLILVILIIQVVAVGGAILFARLSGKWGNKLTIQVMIALWVLVCLGAYLTQTFMQFYIISFLVGLVLGGIQALSRATYAKLMPANSTDTASFFSFYNSTYYVSVVIGTFTYGLIEQLTDNMRYNALMLAAFFVIGFVLIYFLKSDQLKASTNYKSRQ